MKISKTGHVVKKRGRPQSKHLSVPDVATILGVSRTAVYKLVKSGDIPSIKVGKIYGIPQSFLDEKSGKPLSSDRKKLIARAVKKVVKDYGELLVRLGKE
jgi:excisionase family DNA binding protein